MPEKWRFEVTGVPARNTATLFVEPGGPASGGPSVEELFVAGYPEFGAACRQVLEPGLAVVAIDERTGALAGMLHVAAKAGMPRAVIVGRHSQADLVLQGSEALSLRHLAVLVEPARSFARGRFEARYRVVDLRTDAGMTDETGRALRGMRCEGPAIVRCPGFALYFLALGDATDFPESARDAWSFLPARIYFDELPRLPESSQVGASGMRAWRPKESRIVRAGAALAIGTPLIGPSESTVGTLEVVGRGGIERVAVGPEALERGVLVGRYPRCSGAHDRLDASLSRVHLLVIRLADRVYAIDTSSTNGTRDMGGTAVRIVELEEGTGLLLGLGGARVRWVPAAGGGCR